VIDPHLTTAALDRIDAILDPVDRHLERRYPGERIGGQPAHTVYVSAADATDRTTDEWGAAAAELLAANTDLLSSLAGDHVVERVANRLLRNPIQDLRIDFEDGYGWRGDSAEDGHARAAGAVLAHLAARTDGPIALGIRAKGLAPHERRRGIRTLELVLDGAGGVPDGFVFTVPKLRAVEQVTAVVALCEELEKAHGLSAGSLRFELQIESPQAVVGADGTATVAPAIHAADGRCTGLHYGTYDYSAACGITSAQQSLEHSVADHAKNVMLAAAAQTGVWISDGSTQVVPSGDHAQVTEAIRRHFRLVTRSLERGFYQGWDMHPGHLVTRWLATFSFFGAALEPAAVRLQAYLDRQAGAVMDEPATAQALAAVVMRGLDTGSFDPSAVAAVAPAVTPEVLRGLLARRTPED
jgi:citrate lyase beta subunit